MKVYNFPNWFSQYAEGYFGAHLTSRAGQPLRCLQIGAYTGDATTWLLANVLTHPESSLTDVDTWRGSRELAHDAIDFAEVEAYYDFRTKDARSSGRLRKAKGMSSSFFADLAEETRYDFIYVDGDHTALGVMTDAVHAFAHLEVGGLLAFDDYEWTSGRGSIYEPKMAVDAFTAVTADRMERVAGGLQVWLRRIG
jgi:predicted O-methyltransferase YrrM